MIAGIEKSFMYVANTSDKKNIYADFFSTRDKKGAAALANAVTNPSLQTFSKGKNFEEVAKSARAELDARYEEMKKSKKPFDIDSPEGKDWNTLFQNFDRRALYAVSSNEGGKFSKVERDLASSIMSQQQGLAMGLYGGKEMDAATMKAGIDFLNGVSVEEKGSKEWIENMTAAKNGYEYLKSHNDKKREDDDSLSLVKLLLENDKKMMKEKAVKLLNIYG